MVENSDKTKGIAGTWNQWARRYFASVISIIAAVAVLAPIHDQIN